MKKKGITGVKAVKGKFLNEEQAKIKQIVMEKMLEAFFLPMAEHGDKFDQRTMADTMLSCIIMFNREVIAHLVMNSSVFEYRDSFIQTLMDNIKSEINDKIKSMMQ